MTRHDPYDTLILYLMSLTTLLILLILEVLYL